MDTNAIPETAATATETVAETVAPGSTHVEEEPAPSNLIDEIRVAVREEIQAAMSNVNAIAPTDSEPEVEEFSQPTRKPWTHRGSKD